jgi:hypothetical protein
LVLHGAESGKEQTDQNGNDRNHYEQLDKSEGLLLAILREQMVHSGSIQEFHFGGGRLKQLNRLKKSKCSIFFNLVTFNELLEDTGQSGEIVKVFHRIFATEFAV